MIYVFLGQGFEEIEALTTVDILRRSKLDVITVGVGSKSITGSHNITVNTDIEETELEISDNIDMIVLPGGMPGTLNLEKSNTVKQAILFCAENNKYIAAICAAPSILGHMGILNGHKAVCFPGFEEDMKDTSVLYMPVCVSGNIITSRGAGCSVEFALKLSEIMASKEISERIRAGIICP